MQQTGFSDAGGQSQALKAYEQRLELLLHRLTEEKEEKCADKLQFMRPWRNG